MIFDKDLLEDNNGFYELDWWGKTKKDIENLTGFKFASKDEEFTDAVKKLLKILKVKGKEMMVRNVRFKIKSFLDNAQFLVIYLKDDIYGEGNVHLKWTFGGKKSGTTLHCTKVRGCDPVLVKSIFLVVKYLVDGTLDNIFSPEKINSFTLGCDEAKDTCESCRVVFGTAVGLKDHQCSFLHKNDVVEPMDFNKQISNDARSVVQALVGHVIDNGLLNANGQATHPAPPRADITCEEHIKKKLPGGEIRSVKGDGACLSKAISVVCFGSEVHWMIVAKAINKMAIEQFENMKDFLSFPIKRKVSGRKDELEFQNKEEFVKFLMSDESLLMWREGPDLAVVAHLFRLRVDVLVSKDKKLDGGCPIIYGEEFEDRGRIVLLLSTKENHYNAVLLKNPRKNLKLKEYLKAYAGDVKDFPRMIF